MLERIFIEIHKAGVQNSNVFNGGSGGNYGSASSVGYYSSGGTANARSSGGGGSRQTAGGNGGKGVVIIRYLGPPVATGGTITQVGGYTIHTFTANGTFAF